MTKAARFLCVNLSQHPKQLQRQHQLLYSKSLNYAAGAGQQQRWKSTTTAETPSLQAQAVLPPPQIPATRGDRYYNDKANYIGSPKARKRVFYPKEALTIADSSQLLTRPFEGTTKPPPAAVRDFGFARRVILLQPHCQDAAQLKGLAYRIHALARNTSINSIVCSLAEDDNPEGWLSYLMDEKRTPIINNIYNADYNGMDRLWHSGYNIQSMMDIISSSSGSSSNNPTTTPTATQTTKQQITEMLMQVQQLAVEVHGDNISKIPFISFCNGRIEDGGYALAMGGYSVATPAASFILRHGFRGLSFDPVGFSFILPRLGWEYQQACADYPAVGHILALTGYRANARDMVETGLATHFMEGSVQDIMGHLEWELQNLRPYHLQKVAPDPIYSYGQTRTGDANFQFRNYAVAATMYAATDYSASGYEMPSYMDYNDDERMRDDDASRDAEFMLVFEARYSQLVDLASQLNDIFVQEDSVPGILERLRQVAASAEKDDGYIQLEKHLPGDKPLDLPSFAATMVEKMEQQSPLSLCVMHRLMTLGARPGERLDRCMERELNVQMNMYMGPDFTTWLEHETKQNEEAAAKNKRRGGACHRRQGPFDATAVDMETPRPNWKHASVNDVTYDEVEEIIFGATLAKP